MKPLRFLPTIAKLLLVGGMLGLIGCSSADGDESTSNTALHDDDDRSRSLTIDRARINDGRLEVRGETRGEEDDVTLQVLDPNGNPIPRYQDDDEADDREYRFRVRIRNNQPAACVAEVSARGQTVRRDIDNRPAVCDNAPQNNPPVCSIDTPPGNVTINTGGSVNFSSTVTDADGDNVTISWAFPGGNPAASSAEDPGNVTYAAAGTFTASLNATDSNGAACAEQTRTITVVDVQPQNNPPVCAIDTPAGNVTTTAGQAVIYTGTVIDPDANDTVTISWVFEGGTPASSGVEDPGSVTYNTAGTFTTTLDATDNAGASCAQQTRTIVVNPVQQQACNIGVAPTSLNFGGVNVGQSAIQTTTLSNSGDAACNVNITQSGSTDFSATPLLNITVQPGGSQVVTVTYSPTAAGADTGNLAVGSNDPNSPNVDVTLTGNGIVQQACVPANLNTSINSTSQNGCPDGTIPQVAQVPNNNFSIFAINDLGMHCGDLDTRISSILPPFQAMLAQVVQKGATPTLNPAGVSLHYSAASNPNDPILGNNVFDGLLGDGNTYKTNFWDTVAAGSYDPFYPAFNPFTNDQLTPLAGPPFNVGPDVGLPVPNVEHFFLGADGVPGTGDESLTAVTHAMPGINGPYSANDRQLAQEHYTDKPFFMNFPFGYVAEDVNWYEGAGVPFAAFDDNGRENAYPLVRVEARQGNTTVSTVDTVLPISGEANCVTCHAEPGDLTSVTGRTTNSSAPTDALTAAGLTVALSLDDPDNNMPPRVSLEYAGDINILRLHDLTHGANYVTPNGDSTVAATPCNINANGGNGDANCLTNQALVQGKPVVCQVCHYTPALDLAHLGPLTGPEGTIANGRNHLHHKSNSNVMHSHHGSLPGNLFPPIPAAIQAANGAITNQNARLDALENSCYLCHPGTNVQCLRGAMFNGGMLCSDCHGNMEQVGNDFTANVSVANPGPNAWELGGNFYDPADPQPRVPWANEPGCGSCHTGDFNTNIAGDNGTVVNIADTNGNSDGIRLRQAFLTGDAKATPIVPADDRFAEPLVPAATANGVANNGAGNPQLYRVSTGHGGVMCEGCHGATHAEWPNANPNSNDNVTATQLQGHTGTIIECSTCHGTANLGNTLNGPHGMHPVGNDQTVNNGAVAGPRISFVDGGHSNINTNGCDDCHGAGGRGNNQGTVLSVAKKDRRLNGQNIPAGTPIGCSICH